MPGFLMKRGVPHEVFIGPRFAGTYKREIGGWQNTVFPYSKARLGVVAVERRNVGSGGKSVKIYTEGADVGVWSSQKRATDKVAVIGESPLDCMSFAALKDPAGAARYASIRMGFQPEDLMVTLAGLPAGAKVLVATDRDPQGEKFAEQVSAVVEKMGMKPVRVTPAGKDWNEDLRASQLAAEQRRCEEQERQRVAERELGYEEEDFRLER
jgi:hypothetical protein